MPKLLMPQDPPPGVGLEAFYVLRELVMAGRQVFGVPGASLTWGIEGSDAGDVSAGIEGEKKTAAVLRDWITQHPTAMLVHSAAWPGSTGDTDHILILGHHVWLIDSKRWKAGRKYSVTPTGTIKRGTVDFPEGKVKIVPAMRAWREVFGKGIKLAGVVCIAQDKVFVPYDKNWHSAPYRLVTVESLTTFFDEAFAKISDDHKDVVHIGVLSTVVARAMKPRDPRAGLINADALR